MLTLPSQVHTALDRLTVPCLSPVSMSRSPAKTRSTCAGSALVVMSQSPAAQPRSASRTAPPTT